MNIGVDIKRMWRMKDSLLEDVTEFTYLVAFYPKMEHLKGREEVCMKLKYYEWVGPNSIKVNILGWFGQFIWKVRRGWYENSANDSEGDTWRSLVNHLMNARILETLNVDSFGEAAAKSPMVQSGLKYEHSIIAWDII